MAQKQFKDFESAGRHRRKVKALEGEPALEEALKVFEEGMATAGTCSAKLREAEQKVEVLLKGADGKMRPNLSAARKRTPPARVKARRRRRAVLTFGNPHPLL